MFKQIKSYIEDKFAVHFDLKLMGKEGLEALAFVLIDQLEKVLIQAELTTILPYIKQMKLKADMIDGVQDRMNDAATDQSLKMDKEIK